MLEKGLSGWEVMEVIAGGTSESDGVFLVSTDGALVKDLVEAVF